MPVRLRVQAPVLTKKKKRQNKSLLKLQKKTPKRYRLGTFSASTDGAAVTTVIPEWLITPEGKPHRLAVTPSPSQPLAPSHPLWVI
jgi:hypothetical protein